MNEIVLATGNKGKIKEIRELLTGLDFSVLTLEDFPELEMPPEEASSFKENALIKARYAAEATGLMVLADDSGLEVLGLAGAPGVLSARFAGVAATDDENIDKLIEETTAMSKDNRRARFVCALAFVEPALESGATSVKESIFEGTLDGLIIPERRGEGGFGYDPVFFVPDLERTTAELTREEKNKISHRGKALVKFRAYLQGTA
ncbi:MAG: XTP/dITP diphosphatase [Proteobacteria bacterium]|nr:XTP/dITP diphosphatase [Pseudomonadota bacterium]